MSDEQNKTVFSQEWFWIKITTVLFYIGFVLFRPLEHPAVADPVGLCRVAPCFYLGTAWGFSILIITVTILCTLYLLEKRMIIVTIGLGVITQLILNLELSNGIRSRGGVVTMLFYAQAIAYIGNYTRFINLDYKKYRIQFPVQIISAAYVLSALSKLRQSGISWIVDGKHIPLVILKSYYRYYTDTGDIKALQNGQEFAHFLFGNIELVYLLLTATLVLEFFAFLALINRKTTLVYGLMLFGMHTGMQYVLNITLILVAVPMIIFFINPFYYLFHLLIKTKTMMELFYNQYLHNTR